MEIQKVLLWGAPGGEIEWSKKCKRLFLLIILFLDSGVANNLCTTKFNLTSDFTCNLSTFLFAFLDIFDFLVSLFFSFFFLFLLVETMDQGTQTTENDVSDLHATDAVADISCTGV